MNENDQNGIVKVIRLTTGEDVIGTCVFDYTPDEGNVLIMNPMLVMLNRMKSRGNSVVLMAPWLPAEIIDENMVLITYENILTIMNPKADFIEYYEHYSEKFNIHVSENRMVDSLDKIPESHLDDIDIDDEFDNDELDEDNLEDEFLEHVLQPQNTSKKRTIH